MKAIFVAILGIAAALRAFQALHRPLHIDEGLTLSLSALPLSQQLTVLHGDVHPPLFFLFIHGLESLHIPLWAVRFTMVIVSVGSIALLMLLVRLWAGDGASLAAGACAAVMPSLIFYDTWIRMYASFQFLVLLALWLLSLLDRRLYGGRTRSVLWSLWILTVAASLYVQYLAFMALATQLLFAATRRKDFFAQTALCSTVAVALWLPQLPTFLDQLHQGGLAFGWFQSHIALGFWQLASQATVAPQFEGWPAAAAAPVVWLWSIAVFAWAWPLMQKTILPWMAGPTLLTVTYSLFAHKLLYLDRYHLLFAYALAAWTGVAVAAVAARVRFAALAAAVAWGALATEGAAFALVPSFYTTDWKAVADTLAANSLPSDLVIFEQGPAYWAFRYYEHPHAYTVLQVSTAAQIDEAERAVNRRSRVWLVGSGMRGMDPGLRLLHYLQRRYRLAFFEESRRLLPSQDVEVGRFERK